jgi:hypothetical protein
VRERAGKWICPKCEFQIITCRDKHLRSCDGMGPRRKQPKGYTKETYLKFKEGCVKGGHNTVHKNMKKRLDDKRGGYRLGGGIGKQGWYKGFWCNSSWELAYVAYCIDHSINITRNNRGFEYTFKNQKHKYYPDFILDNTYIEIKGYISEQAKAKIDQFPHKLEVIDKQKVKEYVRYVKSKHGKDFVKLYGEIA